MIGKGFQKRDPKTHQTLIETWYHNERMLEVKQALRLMLDTLDNLYMYCYPFESSADPIKNRLGISDLRGFDK